MEYLIIAITYIFVIYMFCNIRKIKNGKKEKSHYNKIYFSIIMIFICFIIWAIIRINTTENEEKKILEEKITEIFEKQ